AVTMISSALVSPRDSATVWAEANGPSAGAATPSAVTRSGPIRSCLVITSHGLALRASELEVQPRREALRMAAAPGGGTGAAVIGEYRMRGIVAVRLDAMTAGADVVMCVGAVERLGPIKVPRQLLVELVPVRHRVHVRLILADEVGVVVVLSTRVARSSPGVRPTNRDPVGTARELILDRRPLRVGARPFILEPHYRGELALEFFPHIGNRQPELEAVLAADLRRPFIHGIVVGVVGRRSGRDRSRKFARIGQEGPAVEQRRRIGRRAIRHPRQGPVVRVVGADTVAAAVHL